VTEGFAQLTVAGRDDGGVGEALGFGYFFDPGFPANRLPTVTGWGDVKKVRVSISHLIQCFLKNSLGVSMGEQMEISHAESTAEQDTTVAGQGLWRMSRLRTREE